VQVTVTRTGFVAPLTTGGRHERVRRPARWLGRRV